MNKKLIILIFISILFLPGCKKDNNFCISILDVGQGDSCLIQTPTGKNILIDAGDEDSYKIVANYLKNKRIKKLDIVIASHLDEDHIGSLDYVISNFDVKNLYTPNQTDDSDSFFNLIDSCNNKNLKINYLSKGNSFEIDNSTKAFVLSPSYITDDNNSNSIVLNINYKNNNFLFTGDCTSENETDIINCYNLENVDFLKVAHHGSKTSSCIDFLNETTPSICVISCGYKNKFGHPHKETLNNLHSVCDNIYRTDVNGSMDFYSDGNKIYTRVKYK